uniref:34 kDa salivary secreted protein n=1 Tax=Ochlerotatus triseriatus TaxID=7162 RepID=C6ZQK1_OCHTR
MEPFLTFALIVAILVPAVQPKPLPEGKCTATDEDLSLIKSALQRASSGRALTDDLSPETLEGCPMLKDIASKIKSVADEISELKESSVSREQVDELKEAFDQKVNEIMKSGDIFGKQSNLESTKEHGQMIDRMTALQVKMTELEKEIAEKTQQMYEDMAELIFERLKMNSTDLIRTYTKRMMDEKLDELMRKLETDYKIFLGALRFLNHLDDQNLIDKVFDGILKRLDGMNLDIDKERENGKYVLVNLLCWTVNNDFLTKKYRDKRTELFRIALKFYPNTGNKEANEADVRSRQYCDARFPANVITWFAVSAQRSGK